MSIELNNLEEKSLTFNVQIQGIESDQLTGALRLVLDEIEYGFPANFNGDEISVVIPPINEVIKRDLRDGIMLAGRLDIMGNGFYMKPWEGQFNVSAPVQIEAKLVKTKGSKVTKESKKDGITVTSVQEGKKKPKKKAVVEDEFLDFEELTELDFEFDEEVDVLSEDKPSVKVEGKIRENLTKASGLLEKVYQRRELLKKKKAEKVKKVQESKKPKPPQTTKKPATRGIQSEADIFRMMSSMGMKNKRVQEAMLEKAEALVGKDDLNALAEQVKNILTRSNLPTMPTFGQSDPNV